MTISIARQHDGTWAAFEEVRVRAGRRGLIQNTIQTGMSDVEAAGMKATAAAAPGIGGMPNLPRMRVRGGEVTLGKMILGRG